MSVPAVDGIRSAAGAREEIGAALRRFFGAARRHEPRRTMRATDEASPST
jgi:hypothetical protein